MLSKLLLAGVLLASPVIGQAVNYDEPVTEEETVEPEAVEEETVVEKETLVDLDNDGIPDAIEDYYNEHIRDQYMFGIGLGSLIGLLTSIVSVMFMISRNAKSHKLIEDANKTHNMIVEKLQSEVSAYRDLLVEEKEKLLEEVKNNQALVEKVNDYHEMATRQLEGFMTTKLMEMQEQTNANIAAFKASADLLGNYARTEAKLQALLEAVKELSLNKENVKSGISEKVFKIVEEATKYE